MQIRRTLAVGALSALALAGFAGAPANADSHLTGIDCTTVDAAIETAQVARDAARTTFQRSNLGQLIKAERAAATADAREARSELKDSAKALKNADHTERREAVKQLKADRKALAKANRGLEVQVLRANAKAEQAAAKEAFQLAQADLEELKEYRSTNCETAEPEVEQPEVEQPEVEQPVDAGAEGTQA
jgi:hypothetical protein